MYLSLKVRHLFQTTVFMLENMPDIELSFGNQPKGASISRRRRRERRANKYFSSIRAMQSVISRNSKLSPKCVGFFVNVETMDITHLVLDIKKPFMADVFRVCMCKFWFIHR